jgi:hypothetical protein
MDSETTKKKGITSAILDMMNQDPAIAKKGRKTRLFPEPFPDYSKSIVTQGKSSPTASGISQGLTYGALGAILGALSGRLTEQDTNRTALLSILGGMLGGTTGYQSGKHQRESENSRLFFLRRMGIDNPGELEAVSEYPGLARKLTDPEVSV